jgi:Flp pilus assembly protein TadG
MPARFLRFAPARRSDERGVVLVWLAITLVLLLGVTAISIDVAYWQVTKNREQRAADAAALAGAVTFPVDPVQSDAQAQGVASDNGYTVGAINPLTGSSSCPLSGNTTICAGAGDQAYQYKVTVAQKVNNFFGGIFGIGSTTVRATAQAEYLGPLKMGSPSNQFGNDPDATTTNLTTYPNLWANINGGGTAKQQGDAYAANWCDANGSGQLVTDGCTGIGNGNNVDYTSNGYYYAVDFTSAGSADLQVFDPAFVNTGQFCTTPQSKANLAAAAALGTPAAPIPGYPEGPNNTADIQKRFQPVGNSNDPADPGWRYCTGDNSFPTSATAPNNGPPPSTTYTVLKATIPGHPESATQACPPITFPGFTGDVSTALKTNTPANFATYFRQWTSLCTVNGAQGDEYFIQVQTDNGGGSNHFAMRGVNGANPAPVTIAGNTYMGMYANVGTQLTKFYLVRVPSAAKGHTLVLNFYDIGDADSQGTLQVIPPTDATGSNISGGVFNNGCQWTGDASGSIGFAANTQHAPWGDLSPITNCKITGVNAPGTTWNAQWSTVTVPIPNDYACNDGDPQGCWLTINYQFAGPVHDVTSWTAALLGDPVRLVK